MDHAAHIDWAIKVHAMLLASGWAHVGLISSPADKSHATAIYKRGQSHAEIMCCKSTAEIFLYRGSKRTTMRDSYTVRRVANRIERDGF